MTKNTLLQQITDFCRLLRQMGVDVTTANEISWCKSTQLIDISERETFYHTARTNLIANQGDREKFDLAFNLFWRYPRPEFNAAEIDEDSSDPTALQDLSDTEDEENILHQWLDTEDADDEERHEDDPIAYSVDEVLTRKDFSQFTMQDMEEARAVIAKLAAILATKLSRRKVFSRKGRHIDFRRSWRRCLVFGGEPIELLRKQQKVKKTKIMLLCDVSGSMDCYAKFLIQFIYGMQQELREVEVAVFSTHLTNITGLLRRKGLAEGLNEVANVVPDWSGGTKIGESLLEFYRQFASSFSSYRSVLILISDGWDRGDTEVLRHSMELLHRHAYKLIWLNPLLGSDTYQPICRGIRTALPYVDYFLPAHNLESLAQLTKIFNSTLGKMSDIRQSIGILNMQVQAAVMIQPGQIEIREFDKPTPNDDSLLLHVDKVGICGSDKHMYLGHTALKFPVIPGHEVVGTVAEIGKNANNVMNVMGGPVKSGDRITVVPGSKNCGRCYYCLHVPGRPTLCSGRTIYGFSNSETPPYLTGEFSEYTYIHGNSWVYKIPDDIPQEIAVLTEPVAVATRAVERACAPGLPQVGDGYSIGSSVAVLGCGPIGLLVIAVLRDSGAGTIIATDLVDSRLEMAQQMGADVVINVENTTAQERIEQMQAHTNGVGVDIAIECAGIPIVFAEALDVVRRGGKVIEVGHYTDSGNTEVRPHQICNKDLDVCGVWAYPQIQFQTALDFLQRTRAPLHKLITHHLPLKGLEKGIDMLGNVGVYKVVIEPHG